MLISIFYCVIIFLLLVFLGIPIAYAMLATGIFYQVFYGGGMESLIIPFTELRRGIKYSYLAMPLFILLGNLMNHTNISKYIVGFAQRIMAKIPGKTGLITIFSCAATGPLTGSANGTTTSIGTVMIPEMKKAGYDIRYSTALLAYSGILGSLIPPSVSGLIYALITNQSVLNVWMATMGAGILYFILLSLAQLLLSRIKGYEISSKKMINKKIGDSKKIGDFNLTRSLPAVLVPVSILGGIYGGVVTATEAGALGSFVTLLLGLFYYKTIRSKKLILSVLYESAYQTACLVFLVCASFVLSNIMVSSLATKSIVQSLLSLTGNRYGVLLIVELLVLILGCFMDDTPIMTLLAPIASAILLPLGFHPLHVAGVFVLICLIGLITPPVGQVLYAASMISKEPIDRCLKDVYIFFIPALISIFLVTFIPGITLFFPRLFNLIE